MALYFYFNETTGDLVYSDKATYDAEGYTSLGEQTNMNPTSNSAWIFDSKRSGIKTVSKDPAIDGKISGLKSMISMFYNCSSLASLDLSGFDTSQVTNMNLIFYGCSSLAILDLSGFDTSRVTSMASMFKDCSSLASLDLSGFDTSKVTIMVSLFSGCSSLASLDLSEFDTSRVTNINNMFDSCSLDTVRCRPKQFYKSNNFIVPSSTGKWYDDKKEEMTDFSSDAATALYADPVYALGSKLVNLQDLKAALETMSGLPLTEDTVIAEKGGEPVWGYETDLRGGLPGFVSRIAQGGSWVEAALWCNGIRIEGYQLSDTGEKNMYVSMIMDSNGPVIKFGDNGITADLTYKDGMPVLPAMGESMPIMAGNHPYGFATYATDEDFEDYVFQYE